MGRTSMRRAGAALAAVAATAVMAAPADAAITQSTTTYAGPAFQLVDADGDATIRLTGTTNGAPPDRLQVDCTNGTPTARDQVDDADGAGYPVAADGSFAIDVPAPSFEYYACDLRAVPLGSSVQGAQYAAFTPARVRLSGMYDDPVAGGFRSTFTGITARAAYWGAGSTGQCLHMTFVLRPADLAYDQVLQCLGVALIEVDDAPAAGATTLPDKTLPGWRPVTGVARTQDPVTGAATVELAEPVLRCAGTSCTSYEDTGVTFALRVADAADGRRSRVLLTLRNAAAAARAVELVLPVKVAGGTGSGWRLPGEPGYEQRSAGDQPGSGGLPALTAGSTVGFVGERLSPDTFRRGALVLGPAPAAASFSSADTLNLRYRRTVPAGGSATIELGSIVAETDEELRGLAAAAVAAQRPQVAFTAPAEGTTTEADRVTVSGTAQDGGTVALTLGGTPVPVAPDGTWSAEVPLPLGPTTLTATATDEDGQTATATRTLTRVAPAAPPAGGSAPVVAPPRPAAPSNLFRLALGRLKRGAISVTVGVTPEAAGRLTARLERRVGTRRQVLARASRAVVAGRRASVTLKLGKATRRTLRTRRRLATTLVVQVTPDGGTARTLRRTVTFRR